MAIQQSKKQSDLEKRLQLLRKQVYGGESVASSKYHVARGERTLENTHSTNPSTSLAQKDSAGYQLPTTNSSSDLTYLHQDLLKIMTFSSLAIGVQLLLFFLLKNHILNLNFL